MRGLESRLLGSLNEAERETYERVEADPREKKTDYDDQPPERPIALASRMVAMTSA
jgi:hypothetical protein